MTEMEPSQTSLKAHAVELQKSLRLCSCFPRLFTHADLWVPRGLSCVRDTGASAYTRHGPCVG